MSAQEKCKTCFSPAPSTSTASEAGVPSGATPPSTALSVESSCTDETRRLSSSCSTCTCSRAASFVPATSILRQRTSSSTETSTRGRRLLLLLIVEVSYFLVLTRFFLYLLDFNFPSTLHLSSEIFLSPLQAADPGALPRQAVPRKDLLWPSLSSKRSLGELSQLPVPPAA